MSNAAATRLLVLIADDDAVTREVVEAWLVGAGYEAIVAADGDAALVLAIRTEPDLVLLDVSMPGLDGLEVCRALQRATPVPPPVIFVTGHGGTDAVVTGLDAGAVDYIVKPLSRDVLVARARAALRSKALRDDLINDAALDALTGLLNRRELDAHTGAAIAHAERYDRPLSCAMVDVDHFKRVNDRHGHAAGDAVMREAATRLRQTCRETDTIGRYGGDEYVVVLWETTAQDAMVGADRVRRAICDTAFMASGIDLHLTASIGIATWDPSMSGPESLYAAADRALYQAKEHGRNRAELLDKHHRARTDPDPVMGSAKATPLP
jgi:diguanylate cyclase (GGDEF)-like protein